MTEKEKSSDTATTTSTHDVKLAEVAPTKVVEAVKKAKADKKKPPAAEPAAATLKSTDAPAPKDPDFRTLKTVPELVAAYNDMVPTAIDFAVPKINTVKTFVDVNTGVLACERLHSAIKKARAPAAAKAAATQEKTMAKKTAKTAKTSKAKAKKGSKKGVGKPRSSFDGKAKIVAIVKENPCRAGTGRFKRVAWLYACVGKTVETFLTKGKSGSLAHAIKAKWVKLA